MTDSRWKNLALEVIGCFISALGLYSFAVAAGVPVTGVAGIGAILFRLFGLPIGVTNIIMNIPIVLICFKYLGKDFFFRSVRCMVLFAIFTDYVLAALPVYQGDRMLATICGGVIGGVGDALIYMQNSSTGGADFVVMALKAVRPHLSLGRLAFITDVVIVLAGGFLFRDVDGIIYGMIVSFIFSVVIDKVMYGANAGKLTLIVTEHGKLVCDTIDATCKRGTTILKAAGGYKQEDKQVVMCACSDKQMYQVQQAVKAVAPASFMVVLESNEVHGEGFRYIQMGD